MEVVYTYLGLLAVVVACLILALLRERARQLREDDARPVCDCDEPTTGDDAIPDDCPAHPDAHLPERTTP